MSLRDSFRIGSNTKTMTSTVILQLVQERKLKLNDPISKFVSGVPNGQKITIAELSEMRSGLYSYSFDPGFNATLDTQPGKAWTPDELLRIAFAHPPDFAPGTQYEYSNTNIVLLGVVIQKLTGMSASQAFQKRIFGPLGMTHTFLPKRTDSAIPTRTRRATSSAPTSPRSTSPLPATWPPTSRHSSEAACLTNDCRGCACTASGRRCRDSPTG